MQDYLVVDGSSTIALTGQRYLIGRGDGCEVLLPEGDGAVSRRHALLQRDDKGNWSIVDLGSRNGTLVNGIKLLDRKTLSDGDRITIGQSQIVLGLPRSQPTIAVEAPAIPNSARSHPTVAVETFDPIPTTAFVQEEVPTAVVEQERPILSPAPSPTERPVYEPPTYERASTFDQPQNYQETQTGSQLAVPVASRGMGLILVGVVLIIFCGLAYFAYIEPRMEQFQSLQGQLAGGLLSLFGNNDMQQQFQYLVYERIACIVGGCVGTGLILVGVLKRR